MLLTLRSTQIELLPDKALYLPSEQTLILSDVHLGKAQTFQKSGIPVPEGDDALDLSRISTLLSSRETRHLIIAGDLFHSREGTTPELIDLLQRWLESHDVQVTLVIGNHDEDVLSRCRHLPMETIERMTIGELEVVHDPAHAHASPFSICGHIHPVVVLTEGRGTAHRLPCYHLTDSMLTLPSFGSFTGGKVAKTEPGHRLFVMHQERVIEVPVT